MMRVLSIHPTRPGSQRRGLAATGGDAKNISQTATRPMNPTRGAENPQLAVIIPTLNEADCLPSLLQQLREQQGLDLELIVTDGGSSDDTSRIATDYGARWLATETGRGRQMNRGAAQARAPLLLFLHADSALTSPSQLAEALAVLQQAWDRLGHQRVAGHFRLRFRRSQPGRELAYRYYEEKSALNRAECTNGDQGCLLAGRFFEELGGFDESLGFLEDQRLAERIRRQGRWITLPGTLVTSARRFEVEGLGRRMLLSTLIMTAHAIGLHEFFQRSASALPQSGPHRKASAGPLLRSHRRAESGSRRRGSAGNAGWPPVATPTVTSGSHAFFWTCCCGTDSVSSATGFCALHDRVFKPLTGLQADALL